MISDWKTSESLEPDAKTIAESRKPHIVTHCMMEVVKINGNRGAHEDAEHVGLSFLVSTFSQM